MSINFERESEGSTEEKKKKKKKKKKKRTNKKNPTLISVRRPSWGPCGEGIGATVVGELRRVSSLRISFR